MFEPTPLLRSTAHVVLVDARDRILLLHANLPDIELWLTPGGALEPDETFEAAALRELWEETGVADAILGPYLWRRTHVYSADGAVHEQSERYYLVRVDAAEPTDRYWNTMEKQMLLGFHWWTLEDLAAGDAVFVPRSLAALMVPVLAGDYPSEPLVLDV